MKSLATALKSKAEQLEAMGLEINTQPNLDNQWGTDPKRVPMMYRAQVQWRCSLHNAKKDNQDLDIWTEQWTYPVNGEARYQRSRPSLGKQGSVYRVEVEFPFRVFSNGGQDSIARPTIGKDGIPFLPGSSVKGLFLRACTPEQAAKYCGRKLYQQGKMQHLPGTTSLRFHGAYPVGNWANRIVDLVHPQGNRQIGTQTANKENNPREESASASALISLSEPRLVFEFSCHNQQIDWQEVQLVLLKSLQLGVGGKTSSGYGMGGNFPGKPAINPSTKLNFKLKADGVSSVLRDGVTPEFRPNLFKAALRGHTRRLLAGVAQGTVADTVVNRWFGYTKAPAAVQLIWQQNQEPKFADINRPDRNPTYSVEGMLYIDFQYSLTDQKQYERDIALLTKIFEFAYVMGGFGKSWRRVWHETFLPDYHKNNFAIGCHWSSPDLDDIQTLEQLATFLNKLYEQCCTYLNIPIQDAQSANWREAWSPKRVAVYCGSSPSRSSAIIGLFHNETFKTTPAIGGRLPHKDHPKKFHPPQNTSSVWHRMLPTKNGQYLEIVTLFHGGRKPWKREGKDQLQSFIQQLKANGLKFTWGSEPSN